MVKAKVLGILEKNRASYISGEKLAETIGVSRSSVWKAIESLRKDGYRIEAVSNKGYALSADNDIISEHSIGKYLSGKYEYYFEFYDEVGSTNTVANERASDGAAEGLVIIADSQTEGKGRLGRKFYSPHGCGLYMSLVLRPNISVEDSLFITTCAAVAVAKAVERVTGSEAKIKWVNDVFCGNKKVCGILTNAAVNVEGGGLDYAVLGVGINARIPSEGYPREIESVAAAVSDGSIDDVRSKIAAAVLDNFMDLYRVLPDRTFIGEYRSRSNVIGKEITILESGVTRPALAMDIDDDCGLLVKTADGSVKKLNYGDVSIKL